MSNHLTANDKKGKLRWLVLGIVASLMFLCCGAPIGFVDRYVLLHIYDYEQASLVSIEGVSVQVSVSPQTRIKTPPPERLQGPPYPSTMMLRDSSLTAVSATLHGVSLELGNGQRVAGEVTVDDKRWQPGRDFVLLYFNFGQTEWDRRPVIVADLEIEFPGRVAREEIRIPMVALHRRQIYIP